MIEEERRVLDRLGERPVDRRAAVVPPFRRSERDPAERRLQTEGAGEARRDADRAAAVARGHEREHRADQRRRRAAARPTRGAVEVPGRACDTVQEVLGDRRVAELGRVGLADDDRSRRAQPRDLRRVARRDVVAKRHRALRSDESRDVLEILDAEGDALERPGVAAGDSLAGRTGLGEERVTVSHAHHGVQRRRGGRDAAEHELHDLDGRDLPLTKRGGHPDQGRSPQIEAHDVTSRIKSPASTRG